MVKGGFQGLDITGVDLTAQSPTLPGAYAMCAGANGKPIRVQTADGQVECSVKKVSTNYVLAGVTGDGKILSITIGSTDGIAVSETTPAAVPTGSYKAGSSIDITDVTSSNPFTVPEDGYITIWKTSSDPVSYTLSLSMPKAYSSGALSLASLYGGPAEGETAIYARTFVKKGSIVFISRATGGGTYGHANFAPLAAV